LDDIVIRLWPTVTSGVINEQQLPTVCALEQNYPNPFNPLTIIKYAIAGAGGLGLGARNARLVVYDLLGREAAVLVNEKKAPGSYEIKFDGNGANKKPTYTSVGMSVSDVRGYLTSKSFFVST
jgi:hypothetical protein